MHPIKMSGRENYYLFRTISSMSRGLLVVFFLVLCQDGTWAQLAPKVTVSNGIIDADIYLPDPEDGYYRGVRFDWSGVVAQLNYKGHSYFGQWFPTYDPFLHDAITGPVEAFDPLGYEQAKPGELFTKVGVGVLERLDTSRYHFSRPYKVREPGKWTVNQAKDKVEFIHELSSGDYWYEYRKVVRLDGSKMIIDHVLNNKGDKPIDTEVFNHNFFVIDQSAVGPGFVIRFPFEIEADPSGLGEFARMEGKEIRYVQTLAGNNRARLRSVKGFSSSEGYRFEIENQNTGAGVRVSCDRPISSLIYWSAPKTVCPEPYIHVKALPGESFSWSITYDYYTF